MHHNRHSKPWNCHYELHTDRCICWEDAIDEPLVAWTKRRKTTYNAYVQLVNSRDSGTLSEIAGYIWLCLCLLKPLMSCHDIDGTGESGEIITIIQWTFSLFSNGRCKLQSTKNFTVCCHSLTSFKKRRNFIEKLYNNIYNTASVCFSSPTGPHDITSRTLHAKNKHLNVNTEVNHCNELLPAKHHALKYNFYTKTDGIRHIVRLWLHVHFI